jgi:hypothetical protein
MCLARKGFSIMGNTNTNTTTSSFISGLKTAATAAAAVGLHVAVIAGGVAIGTVAAAKYLAPKE